MRTLFLLLCLPMACLGQAFSFRDLPFMAPRSSGSSMQAPVGFVLGQTLVDVITPNATVKVGMAFTVKTNDITINAMGRWIISGNSGNDTLSIYNGTSFVLIGSVAVNTSLGTPGAFSYGTVTPFPLVAGNTYYLVISAVNGGNQYYSENSSISHTAQAGVPTAVYNDGTWHPINSTNHTYGPVDFQYTTTNSPTKEFINSMEIAPSGTRHDLTSRLGFAFTVGSSGMTLTHLGRWKFSGNSQTHTVYISGGAGGITDLGSVSVNLSGGTIGTFNYTQLGAPISLSANTKYYVTSSEINGGDFWANDTDILSWHTLDGGSVGAVYGSPGSWNPDGGDNAFVLPNFKYTIP